MPSTVWPADAIAALARIEERSDVLRDLPRRDTEWQRHGRLLVRQDVDPGDLPVRRPDGDGEPWEGQPAVAADALLLSTLPGAQVSCRAFYLDAGVTVLLRGAGLRRSPLLRGARVAVRLSGGGPLVVPRQIDRGRRLRLAWVVEELLAGVSATRRRWPELVDRVSDGVVALWRRADARARPPRRIVAWLSPTAVAEHVATLGLTPADPDALARAVADLERSDDRCLVGWSHGDPVPNNVLELADGRLALVDWERAGRNPLGLDACRMLAALDDPTGAIERLEERFAAIRPSGVLPMTHQAAIALIGLLPTWVRQEQAWRAAGRERGYRVRNARRIRLLERLLGLGDGSVERPETAAPVAVEGGD